ncbi:succinylglutamate desuccinylase [Veronia pacifica]|uniref:Succinylglutamate desuccinylase n=1 Tax=Veronia pacifica TaxID=1080227 RepID=A0A1C3EEU5_9GAMM|nr:succinylglutamate desuccinylase [Veronia pacifica]ODA31777.1 succinylglutamate desuccinylase [Veronia pacifica]
MTASIFDGHFLQCTLDNPLHFEPHSWLTDTGLRISHVANGVLEILPHDSETSIIISSGIHGDETAPIELVDRLASDIITGKLVPKVRLLLIIAHPQAILAHTRFIEENLNRLFNGINEEKNEERALANLYQHCVEAFFAPAPLGAERWHFDLHSAIRNSAHYMFAVVPATSHPCDIRPLIQVLDDAEMNAVMFSRTPSSTFSWFSCEKFGAIGATLEMGRVAPLYQNDMTEFEPLRKTLCNMLVQDKNSLLKKEPTRLESYKVTRTITKYTDHFSLSFSDDAANFTQFDTGELLAQEGGIEYRAAEGGEAVVFPNSKVANGQRACLMVQSFSYDWSKPLYVNIDADPGPLHIG